MIFFFQLAYIVENTKPAIFKLVVARPYILYSITEHIYILSYVFWWKLKMLTI